MAFFKKHSMQQISSTPFHPADSPRSTGVLSLGSFHNPHGSSSQLPWTPVDLQPCPRYERMQHGLSVVLTPFRLSQISEFTPQLLQMPPLSQWMAMDAGISPLHFSSLSPRCRLVPLALLLSPSSLFLLSPSSLSLLFFVLPSSVWIRMFLLSSQGVLAGFTWSSVRTAASLDVLDASVERGVPHFHLPLHHLVHPHLCMD